MLVKVHTSYMNSSYGKISAFLLFWLIFLAPLTVASHQCQAWCLHLYNYVAGNAGYYISKGEYTNKLRTLQCVSFKNDNIMCLFDPQLAAWENNRVSSSLVIIVPFAIHLSDPYVYKGPLRYIPAPVPPSGLPYPLLLKHVASFSLETKTAVSPYFVLCFC